MNKMPEVLAYTLSPFSFSMSQPQLNKHTAKQHNTKQANWLLCILRFCGRLPGFLNLSHRMHDGLAGHSRHENHHDDTHHKSANDHQIVQVGSSYIAASQPSCVLADVPEVNLDYQVWRKRQ